LGGWDREDWVLRPARAKLGRPHLQNNQSKTWTRSVAQAVEYF
jgi:hypothetical protein